MKINILVLITALLLPVSLLKAQDTCLTHVNLNEWVQEGNPAYGKWEVSPDGKSVIQTENSFPTFFVNNSELINVKIKGVISVETDEDDDFIGFVFGYKKPSGQPDNVFDTWLFTWKKKYENLNERIAQEGFSLARVKGTIEDTDSAYYASFWEQPNDSFFEVVSTKWGDGTGWKNYYNHKFELTYTTTRIIIIIDQDTIFNEAGCFEQGRFGFYNFSQKNVRYKDFNYSLAADFLAIPENVCIGDVVTFKSTCSKIPTNIVKWDWDFGDGTKSNEVNPEHFYSKSGTYKVSLELTDEIGCTDKTSYNVFVNELPNPEITGNLNPCRGAIETYYGSFDPKIKHLWSVEGGKILSGSDQNQIRVLWENFGPGKITLNENNTRTKCSAEKSFDVVVKESPTVSAGADTIICTNEPYQLDMEGTGGNGNPGQYTYEWSPPDGLDDPFKKDPVLMLSKPGTYVYTAIVTDSAGCSGKTQIVIKVKENPELKLSENFIDFGTLLGCETSADTTLLFSNPSKEGLTIYGIDPSAPLYLDPPPPIYLAAGTGKNIKIRFEPDRDSTWDGICSILFGPCDDTLNINFRGSRHGISFDMPSDVDMGSLVYCRDTSVTKTYELTNTSGGNTDASISDINVNGPFTTSLKKGMLLTNGSIEKFNISFMPGNNYPPGKTDGSIELQFDPCGITKKINLSAVKADIFLESKGSLDFGTVDFGQKPQKVLEFKNAGYTKVLVNDIISSLPGTFKVESTSVVLPAELDTGASITAVISYTPGFGEEKGMITALVESPCTYSGNTRVSGIANIEPATAKISIGSVYQKTGSVVRIPVILESQKNLWQNGIRGYKAKIKFNKTMLAPYGDTPFGEESGSDRIITISGTFDNPDSIAGVMADLEFTATLGNDSCTTVTLDSIDWDRSRVALEVLDGSFCLSDFCKKGPSSRYYMETGLFGIESISPNPAGYSTVVAFSRAEQGECHIRITDIYGRVVREYELSGSRSGEYLFSLNLVDIASGRYYITLSTSTQRDTKILNILK